MLVEGVHAQGGNTEEDSLGKWEVEDDLRVVSDTLHESIDE
jgi:hypothetical protein